MRVLHPDRFEQAAEFEDTFNTGTTFSYVANPYGDTFEAGHF